jgi:hypothetical protein
MTVYGAAAIRHGTRGPRRPLEAEPLGERLAA